MTIEQDEYDAKEAPEALPHYRQTEDFGGGHIKARHGRLNGWLLIVYVILLIWSLYYGFTYWGGLGPGLELTG